MLTGGSHKISCLIYLKKGKKRSKLSQKLLSSAVMTRNLAFTSVHCCLSVTCWERADLLALVCDV